MEIEQKLEILRKLGTKSLIAKLTEYEGELLQALTQQADFKNQNHEFLGSGDCQEVKRILAELTVQAPDINEAGKRLTIAERENWLQRQRTENNELSEAIQKQRQVLFLQDDYEIKVEIAKQRLSGTHKVLALKIAQINFLAGD